MSVILAALLVAVVIISVDHVQGEGHSANAQELPRHLLSEPDLHAVHDVDGDSLALALMDGESDATYATAAASASIEGVPVCTDHNPTKWHPLVRRDAGGRITCTYGHEHHADPNAANDIFGPVGAWAGISGQEISYPWQTSSSAGMENQVKHEGYKWYVAKNQPCRPVGTAPNDGCFISWRIQVHSLGTAADAVVRFHSFSFEAVVDYHGQRGIVRHGGHIDGGHLSLLANNGSAKACPVIPSNASSLQDPQILAFVCGRGVRREHSGANLPDPYADHSGYRINWYAKHLLTQVGPQIEEWGPIDYQNPSNQLFYGPTARGNNSNGRIENMAVDTSYGWLAPFRDAQGSVRYRGYTDRDGNQVSGCGAPSVDCVPVAIEGARAAQYQFNSGRQQLTNNIEYDVASPVTGKSLIRFPN